MSSAQNASVVVVGGGFAGVACAKHLAKHGVRVTLIDRHDYNQFQPLLYQVATAQVETSDVARPLRKMFAKRHLVTITMADITDIDPVAKTVTSADGITFSATTSCSPWAPSRTSSAPPAPTPTRSRSTPSTMPIGSDHACSPCSRPCTQSDASSTRAR